MQYWDKETNQIINCWKTGKNIINIQPQGTDIDMTFVNQKVIPEMAIKFGNIDQKNELIEKLKDQIKTIEMTINALKGDYIINIIKVGECPF
jgi:hypothetical protein